MARTNDIKDLENKETGYSLIQMSIALVILGMASVGFSQWYGLLKEKDEIKLNDQRVASIMGALQNFRKINGFYPCPASLTAPRTGTASPVNGPQVYGYQTDCTTTADVAVGACGNTRLTAGAVTPSGFVCVREANNVNPLISTKPRVRIGTIPFRDLKIDEEDTYDVYGHRIVYALTERLGSLSTYNENITGINVLDENNVALTRAVDSIPYLVFSPGEDGLGGLGYTGGGNFPCKAGVVTATDPRDMLNCSQETVAAFRFSLTNSNQDQNHFDDTVKFFSNLSLPVWKRADTDNQNIFDLAQQNVGVGVATAEAPLYPLDVKNTWTASSPTSPYGDIRAGGPTGINSTSMTPTTRGKILTDNICDKNGANCFKTTTFSGAKNSADPKYNPQMHCPKPDDPTTPLPDADASNQIYMAGISQGKAICVANLTVACPSGQMVSSVNGDGTLNCMNPPSLPCTIGSWAPMTCPGHYVVLAGTIPSGSAHTPGYAYNKSDNVTCNNGVLKVTSNGGNCSCSPSSGTYTPNCSNCDYLDKASAEYALCKKKADLIGTYTVTYNTACGAGALKSKWTGPPPATAGDINNYLNNYALTFDDKTTTGNVTHLASWPVPSTTYSGATWSSVCTTCGSTYADGQIRNVSTGATCNVPWGGTPTKEQRFNKALCEWEDTGNYTSCTCSLAATRKTPQVCDPGYTRDNTAVAADGNTAAFSGYSISYGKLKVESSVNASTCSYDSTVIKNYCVCDTTTDYYQDTLPTCAPGYEVHTKNKETRKRLTCSPETYSPWTVVTTGSCSQINYTWKDIGQTDSNAAQSVLDGISKIIGASCSHGEASGGGTYTCKSGTATYNCKCSK